jgi:hypothetical protein
MTQSDRKLVTQYSGISSCFKELVHILPATEELIFVHQLMRLPNCWLKNPKSIAERAKYRYIPQRSTHKGTPVFEYTSLRRQFWYRRGDSFYEISPGGYLVEITGFIHRPSAAKPLEDRHSTRNTDNETSTKTDFTNDYQRGNQRGNGLRRGSNGEGTPDATRTRPSRG